MQEPLATYVYASDPILQAGVISQLRTQPEIRVVDEAELDRAAVAVVVAAGLDDEVLRVLRALQRGGVPRTVLVARVIDDATLVAAGEVPADLLGRLLGQVGRQQRQVLAPRGLAFSGLNEREVQVLKLVANGHDTAEIAGWLSYSERTVKNILHDVTTRLQLRNRSHAVNGGGDRQLVGGPCTGMPWRVGIAHPPQPGALATVVEARDLAVATSGRAERGCHIVDPRTGRPPSGLASITVTGAPITLVDAYATAAYAMGPAARNWIEGLDGYEAYAVTESGTYWATESFPFESCAPSLAAGQS